MFMKNNLIIAICFFFSASIAGKQLENAYNNYICDKTIIQYDSKNHIESVMFSKLDTTIEIPKTAEDFFEKMLNMEDGVCYVKNKSVSLSKENETFVQLYNGLEVDGAFFTFHFDNDGVMTYAHGNYVEVSNVPTKPSISVEESKILYAKYKKISPSLIDSYNAVLCIKDIQPDDYSYVGKPSLTYKVGVSSKKEYLAEIVYIDATNGDILFSEPSAYSLSRLGTFNTRFMGAKSAYTDYVNNSYRLYDNSRGTVIWTRDYQNNLSILFTESDAQEVTDLDNVWNYVDFTDRTDMALDVHWTLQQIYDRLKNVYGKNSFDNNGKDINAFVKVSIVQSIIPPATTTDNAQWNTEDKILFFGKGSNFQRPFSSVDVVAHEYGHGITDYQIGWGSPQRYLNEGLSDIWGAIMDYRFGYSDNDAWKIGENIFASDTTNCLRDLSQPNSDLAYKKIASTYLSNTYNNGDDYVKGGVFSHWFYLLVNGGYGQNENGRWYAVDGVGMDAAEALIVKAVYDNYLRSQNTYPKISEAFYNAALALNIDGLKNSVLNAWYAVGVGSHSMSLFGSTQICDSAQYSVYGLPSECSVVWSLTNSEPSSNVLITQNHPETNQCTVVIGNGSEINNTLRASIYHGSNLITVLYKHIYSGNFTGTYSQEGNYYHYRNYPDIPETTFYNHDFINVNQTCLITLYSPFFIGKYISHTGANLSLWNDNRNGTIQLKFPYTNLQDQLLTVTGSDLSGCGNFQLAIKAFYNPITEPRPLLNIKYRDNCIEIVNNNQDKVQFGSGFTLQITNAVTGEIINWEKYSINNKMIDTKHWSPGTYIIKANYGKETATKKITIQ